LAAWHDRWGDQAPLTVCTVCGQGDTGARLGAERKAEGGAVLLDFDFGQQVEIGEDGWS
jgi:hypothetical protein